MQRLLLALLCLADIARTQPKPSDWQSLFDGKTLGRWKETKFTGHASVKVEDGAVVLTAGNPMTGVTWSGEFPKTNYEIRYEAARFAGGDFFASITFPAGDSHATWVLGGWGGDITGISSIDGWDASENETRSYFNFETKRWYALHLRVTDDAIEAWIDNEQVVNVKIRGRAVGLRFGEIELSAPLGIASYHTTGVIRKIEYRPLAGKR